MEKQYKILDVGCGSNKQGDIGVDVRKLKGVDIVCDVSYLPLKNNSFDLVKSSVVIEHVFDSILFLKEQLRVLKNNGKLCCEADNARYWRYHINAKMFFSQDFVYRFETEKYNASKEHLRIYYPECIERLFYKLGIFLKCTVHMKSEKKLDRLFRFFLPIFWKNTCSRFYVIGEKG